MCIIYFYCFILLANKNIPCNYLRSNTSSSLSASHIVDLIYLLVVNAYYSIIDVCMRCQHPKFIGHGTHIHQLP